jgi:HEAT repeat protein
MARLNLQRMSTSMTSLRSVISAALVLTLAGCTTIPKPSTALHPKAAEHLAVLASDAGLQEKARACQELGNYGGPESVPALAALLNHEYLADYARSGLEGIQDPSAGKVLREALGQLNGRNLAGAVNSLGVRREVAAVPDLHKLALDSKRGVAPEALAALGMIGTPEVAKTLQTVLANGPADLRVPAAHAALTAAEQLAKEGNATIARGLLESVVRSAPPGHVATVAQSQVAALRAK